MNSQTHQNLSGMNEKDERIALGVRNDAEKVSSASFHQHKKGITNGGGFFLN